MYFRKMQFSILVVAVFALVEAQKVYVEEPTVVRNQQLEDPIRCGFFGINCGNKLRMEQEQVYGPQKLYGQGKEVQFPPELLGLDQHNQQMTGQDRLPQQQYGPELQTRPHKWNDQEIYKELFDLYGPELIPGPQKRYDQELHARLHQIYGQDHGVLHGQDQLSRLHQLYGPGVQYGQQKLYRPGKGRPGSPICILYSEKGQCIGDKNIKNKWYERHFKTDDYKQLSSGVYDNLQKLYTFDGDESNQVKLNIRSDNERVCK